VRESRDCRVGWDSVGEKDAVSGLRVRFGCMCM
jgi:hypothetical protein